MLAKAAVLVAHLVTAMVVFLAGFFPATAALAPWATISPWHYYNSSAPLANGADPLHLLILAVLTALALAASLTLVDRRDIAA